jgi:hypothetical protein
MFTGSAVRVQAVPDLKLQEGQEMGRRSWKSGRLHPRSPAGARKREGRKEEEVGEDGKGRKRAGVRVAEERGEQEENPGKIPSPLFPFSLAPHLYLSPLLYHV